MQGRETEPPRASTLWEAAIPLRVKLEGGLGDRVLEILFTMEPPKWISTNYFRIGYDEVEKNNPIVLMTSVERNKVLPAEAQRIVDAIATESKKFASHYVINGSFPARMDLSFLSSIADIW
jgi:hypothetical protein